MDFKKFKTNKEKEYKNKQYGNLKDLNSDVKINESENIEHIQNLYDGYIGERNFVPNPYEYGPNATYRNINEGIVYKKNSENLWEAFVKDGKPGIQGPRGFVGGGTGVEEVKRIVSATISTMNISATSSSATDLSNLLGPVFNPTYSASNPLVNELSISAGVSQRVVIPSGTYAKFKFTGFGPFRYRLGTSAVTAISTDLYAEAGDAIITNKNSNTHLAVYGISYGTVYVEGGSIG